MQPGIVSRSSWAVIDDTESVLLDGDKSIWPDGWRVYGNFDIIFGPFSRA